MAQSLAGDALTLAYAWRVTRADGVRLGFTDHDADLFFAGTRFAAASGFSASASGEALGIAVPTAEILGGFSSDAITETDLAEGRYDGARVELFRVDWRQPEHHFLLKVQEIGTVTRSGAGFAAELRGLAARLSGPQGRLYTRRCDASLGDRRCGIDLAKAGLLFEGRAAAPVSAQSLAVAGADGVRPADLVHGRLEIVEGAAAGLSGEIETARREGALLRLGLWLPLPRLPADGDRLRLTVGCDKAFSTCCARFGNGENFRGFPHMPGEDFAYSYVDGQSRHDGRPLVP